MNILDPYRITNKLEPPVLDSIVMRLEARGNNSHFQRMLVDYLDAMNIDAAASVLDIGCGTGVASRTIAKRSDFSGKVTGIDLSPYLIAAAEQLVNDEDLEGKVEFRVGDTHSLEIPDGAFSAVVAHTLVSHVDDPIGVLNELARVVAPGGNVAIFDGDYASISFSHEDPDKAKEYNDAIMKAVITNPTVLRQMPRLLRNAGLELVNSFSYVLADIGKADFWLSALESLRRLVPATGLFSQEEMDAWVDGRLVESEDGTFFGASTYYTYIARRPE
jgi:SAM-dependent methyltransferase